MPRRPSSVPLVEDALLARLQARTGLAGAAIAITLPARLEGRQDKLFFVGAHGVERTLYVEQGARRETYLLPLWLEVFRASGLDPEPARERFWEIVEEIEAELERDPEIANVADNAFLEAIDEVNPFVADNGWIFKAVLSIRVHAVI